ncbi:MAG: methionine/alanine import family NSS transporter small subunit [Lachnospirales bacterium]
MSTSAIVMLVIAIVTIPGGLAVCLRTALKNK